MEKMGLVNKKLAGKADGKIIAQIVKSIKVGDLCFYRLFATLVVINIKN